jgi:hypothetical protein
MYAHFPKGQGYWMGLKQKGDVYTFTDPTYNKTTVTEDPEWDHMQCPGNDCCVVVFLREQPTPVKVSCDGSSRPMCQSGHPIEPPENSGTARNDGPLVVPILGLGLVFFRFLNN